MKADSNNTEGLLTNEGNHTIRVRMANVPRNIRIFNNLKREIMSFVTRCGMHLLIDVSGLSYMSTQEFEYIKMLSTIARKNGSDVQMIGIEPELEEIITLMQQFTFFDINSFASVPAYAPVAN